MTNALVDVGGGGSTTSICSASPLDTQSQIDNILSRLTLVETVLSQLLGTDISAIQLSDISQDAGNITGINLGAAMSNIAMQALRVNAFASTGKFVMSAFGNVSDLDAGGFYGDTPNGVSYDWKSAPMGILTEVNKGQSGIVQSSTQGYRVGTGGNLYNGGFYFTARVGFPSDSPFPAPPTGQSYLYGSRVFVGLHTDTMRGYMGDSGNINTGYNNEKPDIYDGDPFNLVNHGWIAFHYCPPPSPRGDTTWHIIVRDVDAYLTYTNNVFDTGVPVIAGQMYELSMRCEPGASLMSWTITNLTTGAISDGGVAPPSLYSDPDNIPNPMVYCFVVGLWNNNDVGTQWKRLLVQSSWCQTLDLSTP